MRAHWCVVSAFLLAACSPVEPSTDGQEIPCQAGQGPARFTEGGEDLWTIVTNPELSAGQQRWVDIIEARSYTVSLEVVRLAHNVKALLLEGEVVGLTLAPDMRIVATQRRVETNPNGILSWSGWVADDAGASAIVAMDGEEMGGIFHLYAGGGRIYSIEPLEGGLHATVRWDPCELPPER